MTILRNVTFNPLKPELTMVIFNHFIRRQNVYIYTVPQTEMFNIIYNIQNHLICTDNKRDPIHFSRVTYFWAHFLKPLLQRLKASFITDIIDQESALCVFVKFIPHLEKTKSLVIRCRPVSFGGGGGGEVVN